MPTTLSVCQEEQDTEELSGDGEEVTDTGGDVVLRFNLQLKRNWEEALGEKTSEEFAEISTKLSQEIQKLFTNVAGKQEATVAEFR